MNLNFLQAIGCTSKVVRKNRRTEMSGEFDKCCEHALDCTCSYPKCQKCRSTIYRYDQTCMRCLMEESKDLLERTKQFLEKLGNR